MAEEFFTYSAAEAFLREQVQKARAAAEPPDADGSALLNEDLIGSEEMPEPYMVLVGGRGHGEVIAIPDEIIDGAGDNGESMLPYQFCISRLPEPISDFALAEGTYPYKADRETYTYSGFADSKGSLIFHRCVQPHDSAGKLVPCDCPERAEHLIEQNTRTRDEMQMQAMMMGKISGIDWNNVISMRVKSPFTWEKTLDGHTDTDFVTEHLNQLASEAKDTRLTGKPYPKTDEWARQYGGLFTRSSQEFIVKDWEALRAEFQAGAGKLQSGKHSEEETNRENEQ